MAPLFLFLASSLNVELVYIILKGITQFSYVTFNQDSDNTFGQRKFTNLHLTKGKENSDLVLRLERIKVKNIDSWENAESKDVIAERHISTFLSDDFVNKSLDEEENEELKVEQEILKEKGVVDI